MKPIPPLIMALLLPAALSAAGPEIRQQPLYSQHTGRHYTIQTAAIGQEPADGYPVLYLLDGGTYFPVAAHSAPDTLNRHQNQAGTALLLVGIAYPQQAQEQRAHDYTLSGAAGFARFLHDELTPHIQTQYRIRPQQQALFGHSYGGLFAVYHLFTAQTPYRHYFISSPSLWYDRQNIWTHTPQHIAGRPQIRISAGGQEQAAAGDKRRKERAMIANAEKLYRYLQQKQLNTCLHIYPGEHHGSVAFSALHDALKILRDAYR